MARLFPIVNWVRDYRYEDLSGDFGAGVTVGAMLVPQAMAYALLAGLPPEVGLYAATIPLIAYALFGTSRQLAVGPVAIVSLLTASALAPLAQEESVEYLTAAATLAVMVGILHLVLGIGRLGFLVNFLSHAVLVGFTAAAAIIIGLSQAKHLLGVSVERKAHFYETVLEVASRAGEANRATVIVGLTSLVVLVAMKRVWPRSPRALIVVAGSIGAVELFGLQDSGVRVIGDIPPSLPRFGLPMFDGSLISSLLGTACVITVVGFMESIAVAKVYARRHGYELGPNSELVGLGAANITAGLFGGYPVTGGFSRTAVNDGAGARTPLASLISAGIVLASIAFLTPLLTALPYAALGAIILAAVAGLVDIAEMKHIAAVKPSDLVGLGVAFCATLVLGIELGIVAAVLASMLVVFARMSKPHSAVLGHVEGTTSYRNVDRFPEVQISEGVSVIRVDAALSFVNALKVKRLLMGEADRFGSSTGVLVLDASGINDVDASGVETLAEIIDQLAERGVSVHLSHVKGPVRDVLRRAGVWDRLGGQIHASTFDAVQAISSSAPSPQDHRLRGIDERPTPSVLSGRD